MNIICVGITGSANGVGWGKDLREFYADTRDIRQRVLFDPTAELVGGLSGGGLYSYMCSRFRAQHVAGVLTMAGLLGRVGWYSTYQTTDRVQTNLLVARTEGLSDPGGWVMIYDSNFLASCGAVVQDWWFNGGHQTAPDPVKTECLTWLLNQRIQAGPNDQSNALAQATDWQARVAAGQQQAVLFECVSNLMNRPRSWYAYQAQLMLDQLFTNYTVFRSLNVSNLFPASSAFITNDYYPASPNDYWSQSDFASDMFFYYAYGASTNHDWPRYYAALKALTGITGTNGDRAGDIYSLLQMFGYPAPVLQPSVDPSLGQMNLWLCKDTPGLAYSAQSRTNLINDVWQDVSVSPLDTNTIWSAGFDLQREVPSGFYRVRTAPSPATSPPWPAGVQW